jgi:hybrid cluster-associated redox disulfide protein
MKPKPKSKAGKSQKIEKGMMLAEVVMRYPETIPVFQMRGLHCIGCAVSAYESVEQGALAHGIEPDTLVRDLNNAVKKPAKAAGKTKSRRER